MGCWCSVYKHHVFAVVAVIDVVVFVDRLVCDVLQYSCIGRLHI